MFCKNSYESTLFMCTLRSVSFILFLVFASSGCRATRADLIGKYRLVEPNHNRKGSLELMPDGRLREVVEKSGGGSSELVGVWSFDTDGFISRQPCVAFDGFSDRESKVDGCGTWVEKLVHLQIPLDPDFGVYYEKD